MCFLLMPTTDLVGDCQLTVHMHCAAQMDAAVLQGVRGAEYVLHSALILINEGPFQIYVLDLRE